MSIIKVSFLDQIKNIENKFLILFPNAFEDKEWLKLVKKHDKKIIDEIFKKSLSKNQMREDIEKGNIENIINACKKAVQNSTTISMFEKIAFRNYMTDKSLHKEFAKTLYLLLHVDYTKYLSKFVYILTKTRNTIGNSNCAKWTIVTFFLSYSDGDTHVFLKPNTAKKTSHYFSIDINYQAYPNLETYEKFRNIIIQYKEHCTLTKNDPNIKSQAVIFCALSIMPRF